MMSQAVEGTWIRTGGYSLRGRRSKGKGKGILARRLGQLTLQALRVISISNFSL